MTIGVRFHRALALAICGFVFATTVSTLQAQTAPAASNNVAQESPSRVPLGAVIQRLQPSPLPAPFVLSPADEANLNKLLVDWEASNSKIKTFACNFTRLEYNPAVVGGDPNQVTTESHGVLKYAAPDKGMFKVTRMTNFVPDLKSGKIVKQDADPTEWWTCDGKSMFEVVDKPEKLVVEKPLPPEMRGQAITDGPLPFVFGAKAAALKSRYYMRVVTPPQVKDDVWLEAFPKQQKDAANFSRVTIILRKSDLQPWAIQIFNPGANTQNNSRTMIKLEDASINSLWAPVQYLFDDFAQPHPIGYRHVVDNSLINPNTVPAPNLQTKQPSDNTQAARLKATPQR
jgi:TIGR03009 family protein